MKPPAGVKGAGFVSPALVKETLRVLKRDPTSAAARDKAGDRRLVRLVPERIAAPLKLAW
jgi:hypothetical protein